MRKLLSFLLLSLLATSSGCATAVTPAREAYILSKPHGWLELTVDVQSVPARPPKEGETKEYPLACSLSIVVNREHYMTDGLYPLGEIPPFSIKTGFRLAVPERQSKIELTYADCTIVDGKITDIRVETTIEVREGYVASLIFNGNHLLIGDAEPNSNVTLESINSRLQNIETDIKALK